jgi:O-phosphoseryl-tRNA(Cys) synthetase
VLTLLFRVKLAEDENGERCAIKVMFKGEGENENKVGPLNYNSRLVFQGDPLSIYPSNGDLKN